MSGWGFRDSYEERQEREDEGVKFLQHVYGYKCKHGINTCCQECKQCTKEKELLEKLEKGEL